MNITEDEFRRAGEIAKQMSWNDEELRLLIKVHKLLVAFLEGKGPAIHLMLVPLRMDLNEFEDFADARKLKY